MAYTESQSARRIYTPERYKKNQFSQGCYYYIREFFDRTGAWLTFDKFRDQVKESFLKQCHISVFNSTISDMQTERLQHSGWYIPPHERAAAARFEEAGELRREEAAAEERRPAATPARIAEAQEWVRNNHREGWGPFHAIFPEREFEMSWFMKQKQIALTPSKPIKFGPRTGPEVRKLAEWINSSGLTATQIDNLTAGGFRDKTGNTVVNTSEIGQLTSWWNSAQRIVLKHLEAQGIAVTKKTPPPPPPPPKPVTGVIPAGAFVVLADIPLEAYPELEPVHLKRFVQELVKKLHEKGDRAQVRLQSDPASIEIRVPAA